MKNSIGRMIALASILSLSAGMLAACGGSTGGDAKAEGKVYYLNFKGDTQDDWERLGEEYTKQTGVPVTVQTATSGTYESTLKSEVAKKEAPTLFQVNGPVGLATWKDYCADLKDTELYSQLKNPDLALTSTDGEQILAVPYSMESYGLIYNTELMDKYLALPGAKVDKAEDIDSFDKLKEVADDLQARKDELGIKGAFTSTGFDSSSDWRFKTHLANIPLFWEFHDDDVKEQPASIKGTYLKNFKNIFDLYLTDSTVPATEISGKTLNDSTAEFTLGEAMFYQNGTWIWADLKEAGMTDDQVGMLPIYIGADGEEDYGLATGTENYWAINSKVSEADQKATADFLEWVLTSDEGKTALTGDMALTTPFKSTEDITSDNPLTALAVKDADNKKSVSWAFTMIPSEQWKNDLGSAMLEYAQGTGQWNAVETAFVDGWAKEYQNAHK